jgi:hypothetical protein
VAAFISKALGALEEARGTSISMPMAERSVGPTVVDFPKLDMSPFQSVGALRTVFLEETASAYALPFSVCFLSLAPPPIYL